MRSIKYVVAGLIAAGLAASSYAAAITVNWATLVNTYVSDSSGNPLTGDLLEIGTFASLPTVGSANLASFVVFGTATDDSDGVFVESTTASDSVFAHKQIYFVAFNNATGAGPGAGGQEAIFYVPDITLSNWRFPAGTDIITSTTLDLQDGFVGDTGVLANNAVVVYGKTGVETDPSSLLETVPEPSSIALVAMGLLGGIGMIRRRRS
jgi:hypothetical protein